MKVCCAEHDHMVKAFASHRTDHTLHADVLPGRPRGRWSIQDTKPTQASLHDVAIDGILISYQVPWRRIPREGLGHLPLHPLGRWVRRHGVVNALPAAMRKNYQTVEQLEADRRRDKHIRGGDAVRVGCAGTSPSSDAVAGDA
jgi:hypothetical protein